MGRAIELAPTHLTRAVGLATFFLLLACAQATEPSDRPGATGICYSRLVALNDSGEVVTHYQSVIVRGSGNLKADIERAESASASRLPLRNPDLVANKWHSAWISATGLDGTNGPDCSGLPMVGETEQPPKREGQ